MADTQRNGLRGPWTYERVCALRGLVLACGVGIAALVWFELDSWPKTLTVRALMLAIFVNSAWATAEVLLALAGSAASSLLSRCPRDYPQPTIQES